jgi:Skp family chaperone for outer membrane proteins
MTRTAIAAVAVCASLAAATSALAQTAAPAASSVTHGPALNNVCVLSVEGAIGTSTVGKYVDSRMQQIISQVNAELNAEKTGIDTEAKSLDGQRGSLEQSAFERRASDLQVRANALQRKAELRDREVQATEQKALARVGQELDPLLRQVYQQKQCSVLLNRNAILIANPAMDLTPQVVTALNAKITQFAFDRERLDQGQAAARPAAAAPAAPARK